MKSNVLFGIGTALTVAGVVAIGHNQASAVPVNVVSVLDLGTSITFDPNTARLSAWDVGGADHVFTTQYQYDTGSGFTDVGSGGLSYLSHSVSTFGADKIFTVNYDHADFTYQLRLTLSGGFGSSSLLVTENIIGKSTIAPGGLTMALREFSDLDMANTSLGDTLNGNNNSVTQTDTTAQFVQNFVGASGVLLNPLFANTTGIETVPGDASFTYTWNFTLLAGGLTGPSDPDSQGTVTIQKQISTFESTGAIPEPVTVTLSLASLLVLGGAAMRRSR